MRAGSSPRPPHGASGLVQSRTSPCPAPQVRAGGASFFLLAQRCTPEGTRGGPAQRLGITSGRWGTGQTLRWPLWGDSVPALDDQLPGGDRGHAAIARTAGCSRRRQGRVFLPGPRASRVHVTEFPSFRSGTLEVGVTVGPGLVLAGRWGAVPPGDPLGVARTGQGYSGWLVTSLTQPALTDAPSWRRSPVGLQLSAHSLEGVPCSPGL